MNARVRLWQCAAMAAMTAFLGAGATACTLNGETMGSMGSFERTLEVSGPVDLEVRTGSGTINIRTGSEKTVRVVGHIWAHGLGWGDLEPAEQVRRLEATPPIDQRGNAIVVGEIRETELRNVAISYELTVPFDTRIRAHSGSGSQVIGSVRGPVEAKSGSGRLRIEHVGSHVRASTGSGRIEAFGADAGLDARAGSGSVYAEAIGGPIRVRTGSGRIDVEQVTPGPIDISAGSGAVTIKAPQQAALDLDVRTGSGAIETHRPIEVQGTFSRHRLQGRLGGGGHPVVVTTGSGRVSIE